MKKTMAVVVMLFLACFVIEATVDAGEDCKKGEKVVAQNVDSAQPVTDAATDESTAAPAKAEEKAPGEAEAVESDEGETSKSGEEAAPESDEGEATEPCEGEEAEPGEE